MVWSVTFPNNDEQLAEGYMEHTLVIRSRVKFSFM